MRKNLKIASLLPCVALLALALAGCEKQAEQQMQALPVDVFTVTTMDVPVVSHLTGRANPTRMAEVRPQVSGVIQRRLFTEGSTVKQGDQLYQIDPALYEAQVASAQAALSSAKATLHSSQLKAERYANLLEKKAVSKQDYDDAQATYLANKAAVESAQAALQTAQINLAYTKVYAPISGTINRSNVTEGALVSAQQATALTNHFQQAATGMMVLFVGFQVFGQIADPFGQDGNLYFRGPGVLFVDAVGFDEFFLSCRR